MLKYALDIENHPDNLSAALFGGFVVSCVDQESGECFALKTQVAEYPFPLFFVLSLLFV